MGTMVQKLERTSVLEQLFPVVPAFFRPALSMSPFLCRMFFLHKTYGSRQVQQKEKIASGHGRERIGESLTISIDSFFFYIGMKFCV